MKEQQLLFKKDKDALKAANQQRSDEFTKQEDKLVSALFLVSLNLFYLSLEKWSSRFEESKGKTGWNHSKECPAWGESERVKRLYCQDSNGIGDEVHGEHRAIKTNRTVRGTIEKPKRIKAGSRSCQPRNEHFKGCQLEVNRFKLQFGDVIAANDGHEWRVRGDD